jgi:hypothetical protein
MSMFKKYSDEFCKAVPLLIVVGILCWKHYAVTNPNRGSDEILKKAIQRQIEQGPVSEFSSLIPISEGTRMSEPRSNAATPAWSGKYSTKQLLEPSSP